MDWEELEKGEEINQLKKENDKMREFIEYVAGAKVIKEIPPHPDGLVMRNEIWPKRMLRLQQKAKAALGRE